MALDTYIPREEDGVFKVARYKSTEHMETMDVFMSGPAAASVEKRRKIVHQWCEDGRPDNAIYWIENNKIESNQKTTESYHDEIHHMLQDHGWVPTTTSSGEVKYKHPDREDSYTTDHGLYNHSQPQGDTRAMAPVDAVRHIKGHYGY